MLRSNPRWTCPGLVLALGLALTGPPARADLVVAEAGSTTFDSGTASADGDVSYVVLQNTDTTQSWVDTLGLSGSVTPLAPSASVDEYASYIYLYQVENSDPNPSGGEDSLTSFTVVSGGATVTSFGYLDDSKLVPGSDPTSVVTAGGATVSPTAASTPSTGYRAFFFVDPATGNYEASLDPGETSSILIVTSNAPPITSQGLLNDLGQTSGNVPAPVPEPGAMLALASCLPFGLLSLRRRKAVARP